MNPSESIDCGRYALSNLGFLCVEIQQLCAFMYTVHVFAYIRVILSDQRFI